MTDRAEVDDIVSVFRQLERNARAAMDLAEAFPRFKLVAFKGIHLAYAVAHHPLERPCGDADLWVARGGYRELLREVRRDRRWSIETSGPYATILCNDEGARVDLQRYPWPPPFRERERALLMRDASAPPRLGGRLRVPHIVDATIIAVVHFVKDGLGSMSVPQIEADVRLLEAAGATPREVSARLRELGLFRAGLVGVTALALRHGDFQRWVDELGATRDELVRAERDRAALAKRTVGSPGFLVVPAMLRDRALDRAEALLIALLRETRWHLRRARGEV